MREVGAPLSVERLRELADAGRVDTVLVALTDMQGRLQGKRCGARYFLEEVLSHGTEACDYLMAVDVEMNPVSGYASSSWDRGYGDFLLRPDLATLRLVPWHEGTAMVQADVLTLDGDPVPVSPRQVLKRQLDRLAEHGMTAHVGTELEFVLYDDTYEDAQRMGYKHLTPSNLYNVDYSLLGTGRVEPVLRDIRNGMTGAGMYVESAKGECNPGQHEIVFRYTEALTACDDHAVYKTGAKEIAAKRGHSLTFMAKVNEREGNSCHIHMSLRQGGEVLPDELFSRFLAGQLACLREFTAFYAPNINSYKRFAAGSFAPTAVAWGVDNRTCALRVVGHGESRRVENRVPGGDVNPYLAVAAMVAAGLHGIERGLDPEPAFTGNAYESDRPRVPATLRDAAAALDASAAARAAFGDGVVDHYLNAARVEQAAFDAAVTDWELARGFERL